MLASLTFHTHGDLNNWGVVFAGLVVVVWIILTIGVGA